MSAKPQQMVISAAEFKARCLNLMDEVRERRLEIVITKRGKAVAKLVAVGAAPPLYGSMKGSVTVLGDMVAPSGERWDADE